MTEEYVDYAGRSEPKERWLKALPLIIAGVLGVPLLGMAILFYMSAAIFGIGAWLGRADPFWVEGGQRHLLDEESYLDV